MRMPSISRCVAFSELALDCQAGVSPSKPRMWAVPATRSAPLLLAGCVLLKTGSRDRRLGVRTYEVNGEGLLRLRTVAIAMSGVPADLPAPHGWAPGAARPRLRCLSPAIGRNFHTRRAQIRNSSLYVDKVAPKRRLPMGVDQHLNKQKIQSTWLQRLSKACNECWSLDYRL